MKPKPIRRSESIMKLSREHHFSLLFCWKIREGLKKRTAPKRMVQYAQYFWSNHIQPHFLEEEEILFAPLQDEMVLKAMEEHAAIREGIEALTVLPPENITDELTKLADQLDKHVRYEERQLFPHLENVLSDAQLESIGAQLNALPSAALKDDYQDEFWREKNASL
ncbi:hemerythrin domain-containing protein [Agriterribacter humi]|jgi:hemerythrin-like domain-containing protein|uniref:hemerythrin domain-containing protein n=1 Tax=Agriterribacter humi TaxID=1104781 RepID=UPI001264F367|nr:hemerythrin domain-containing protein [Agriterribacter humi]